MSLTLLQNIAGVHDNRGIIPGLNCRQLTVPLVVHLLTDQLRRERLGNQTVGIGLGLSFDQFGFCIDLRSLFFLIGLGDGNLLFLFSVYVGGLLLNLGKLQILLGVDLFSERQSGSPHRGQY